MIDKGSTVSYDLGVEKPIINRRNTVGTPMMDQAGRILEALHEGQVTLLIVLYDKGLLVGRTSRRLYIQKILVDCCCFSEDEANYWLDEYRVY